MNMSWLFFSFEGRVNRAIWWAVIAGTLCLDLGVYLLSINWESQTLTLVVGLVALALRIAPGVKRLHDRNKSGAWLWLYYGLPQLAAVMVFATEDVALLGVLGLISLALVIAVIVDLGVLPGTNGDNRYGPDPLAGRGPGGFSA